MLKALLFNTPDCIHGFDLLGKFPNLGLVSIAGNVDKDICDVKVADLVVVEDDAIEFARYLIRLHNPDIVGVSCMTFQYFTALEIAKAAKEVDSSIPVVIGGYHPTLMFDEVSRSDDRNYVDFIIRSEGEATFNELAKAMVGKMRLEDVAGLSYKNNGGFRHNPTRVLLDVNSIKLPDRDARIIKEGFHAFGLPADTSETSRGCTFDCTFCCITRMYGRSLRKYPLERVMMDLEDAKRHGAKSIFFVDDNITLDVKRLEKLCETIVEYGHDDMDYHIQASVQGISSSETLVKKMAKAGFKLVFLGIESISQRNLAFLAPGKDRVGTHANTGKAVSYLRKYGMIVAGGFILGNPDDTEEDFWATVDGAQMLKVDLPLFFLSTPYPKTQLREDLLNMGLVANLDNYSQYNCLSANVRTKTLSEDQIEFLLWKMYQKWFSHWKWLGWTHLRKNYPFYLARLVLKLYPRYLAKRLLLRMGLTNEMQLYLEDKIKMDNVYSVRGRPSMIGEETIKQLQEKIVLAKDQIQTLTH